MMNGNNFENLKWSFENMISEHISQKKVQNRDYWMYYLGRCTLAKEFANQLGCNQLETDFNNFRQQIEAIIDASKESEPTDSNGNTGHQYAQADIDLRERNQ